MKEHEVSSDIFQATLAKAREQERLVVVHTSFAFADNFDVGTVIDVDSNAYALSRLSAIGLDDGVVVARVQDIVRIDTSGTYVRSAEACRSSLNRILSGTFEPAAFRGNPAPVGEDLFRWHLLEAARSGDVVRIWACDTDIGICAVVTGVSGNSIEFDEMDEHGVRESRSLVRLGSIPRLHRAGVEHRKVGVLLEHQGNKGSCK